MGWCRRYINRVSRASDIGSVAQGSRAGRICCGQVAAAQQRKIGAGAVGDEAAKPVDEVVGLSWAIREREGEGWPLASGRLIAMKGNKAEDRGVTDQARHCLITSIFDHETVTLLLVCRSGTGVPTQVGVNRTTWYT